MPAEPCFSCGRLDCEGDHPCSDYEPAVCMNCGNDEHTAVELAACIDSVLAPVPTEGVSRCECGCKYWEAGCCIDCGTRYDRDRHD